MFLVFNFRPSIQHQKRPLLFLFFMFYFLFYFLFFGYCIRGGPGGVLAGISLTQSLALTLGSWLGFGGDMVFVCMYRRQSGLYLWGTLFRAFGAIVSSVAGRALYINGPTSICVVFDFDRLGPQSASLSVILALPTVCARTPHKRDH